MMFDPNIRCDPTRVAFASAGSKKISPRMAKRLSDGFNFAVDRFPGHGGSFWAQNDERNTELIAALRTGHLETVSSMASDPASHSLFWGVDGLTKGYFPEKNTDPLELAPYIWLLADGIMRLAEATGAEPVIYTEALPDPRGDIKIDKVLDAIERKIGTAIDFPNPFPNEFGIRTSRGVASYRTFQAIYQAWRLLCLSRTIGQRIVEIGPGIGRTAYYARKFG